MAGLKQSLQFVGSPPSHATTNTNKVFWKEKPAWLKLDEQSSSWLNALFVQGVGKKTNTWWLYIILLYRTFCFVSFKWFHCVVEQVVSLNPSAVVDEIEWAEHSLANDRATLSICGKN